MPQGPESLQNFQGQQLYDRSERFDLESKTAQSSHAINSPVPVVAKRTF